MLFWEPENNKLRLQLSCKLHAFVSAARGKFTKYKLKHFACENYRKQINEFLLENFSSNIVVCVCQHRMEEFQ